MAHAFGHHLVDRLHVSVSERQVLYAVRNRLGRKIRYGRSTKQRRKEIYRMALAAHRDNMRLYVSVMRGW